MWDFSFWKFVMWESYFTNLVPKKFETSANLCLIQNFDIIYVIIRKLKQHNT